MEAIDIDIPELPPEWNRATNELMKSMGATDMDAPAFYNRQKGLFVVITKQREQDGNIWIHVSVSKKKALPSYYDLCDVKKLFLGSDVIAYLVFAPERDHVNINPYCHHLWSPAEHKPTPDFTWGMGTI